MPNLTLSTEIDEFLAGGVLPAVDASDATGNATGLTVGNATTLATSRTIGGSSFNGSANITSFPAPGAIGGTTPSTGAFTTLTTTGNISASATGTSGASPRVFGITDFNSAGQAAMFRFGGSLNSLQTSFGGRLALQSYWGIEIAGSRQSGTALGFTAGASSDASLSVLGTVTTAPVLVVSAAPSQSADIQKWTNSAGTTLASVSSSGALSITGTSTLTGGIILGSFTVGTFPTTQNFIGVVTDANTPVSGSPVAAGGSDKAIVMYSGTTKTVISPLP